jgi:hypothetical protein
LKITPITIKKAVVQTDTDSDWDLHSDQDLSEVVPPKVEMYGKGVDRALSKNTRLHQVQRKFEALGITPNK